MATYTVASDKPNGTYTLNEISIRDGRAQENRLALNNQGEQNQYGGDGSPTGHLTHGFNFADYTIEVTAPTGGSISDSLMPTMTSITPVTGTVNVGNIASVNYVADGTGSDLKDVVFYFRNEASGSQFSVSDQAGDGNATAQLTNSNLVSGTYEFQNGWVVDQANNRLSLNAEDFDASITLVVPDNLTDPQTDFVPPILDDFSFLPDIA